MRIKYSSSIPTTNPKKESVSAIPNAIDIHPRTPELYPASQRIMSSKLPNDEIENRKKLKRETRLMKFLP